MIQYPETDEDIKQEMPVEIDNSHLLSPQLQGPIEQDQVGDV